MLTVGAGQCVMIPLQELISCNIADDAREDVLMSVFLTVRQKEFLPPCRRQRCEGRSAICLSREEAPGVPGRFYSTSAQSQRIHQCSQEPHVTSLSEETDTDSRREQMSTQRKGLGGESM